MGKWTRDRLPLVVGLVLVGGAVAWMAWVHHLSPAERDDDLGYWGFVLGLVGVLIPVLVPLWRGQRPAGPRSGEASATLLAQAVNEHQFRHAKLQDYLATQASSNSAPVRTPQHPLRSSARHEPE